MYPLVRLCVIMYLYIRDGGAFAAWPAFMFRAIIDCARWRGKGQNYPPRPKLLMLSHFLLAFFAVLLKVYVHATTHEGHSFCDRGMCAY